MNMQSLKNYGEINSTTTSAPSQPEDSKLLSAVHALTKNQICAEKNLARTERAVRLLASVISNNTVHDDGVNDDDDDSINSDSSLNAIASFLCGSGKRSDFRFGRDKI